MQKAGSGIGKIMSSSLSDLPNELLQHILCFTPPISVAAFHQVSRRFSKLADSTVWRHHCLSRFKYWSDAKGLHKKLLSGSDVYDWKGIYARRHRINQETKRLVNSIISSQIGRLEKLQTIIDFGYDAKDCLLDCARVDDSYDDVLARRYATSPM